VNPVAVAPAAEPKSPSPNYTLTNGDIQIVYRFDKEKNANVVVNIVGAVALDPGKTDVPPQIVLTALFPLKDVIVKATTDPFAAPHGKIVLGAPQLQGFAERLLAKLVPPNVAGPLALPAVLRADSVQVADAINKSGKPGTVSDKINVILIPYHPATAYSAVQADSDVIRISYELKDKKAVRTAITGKFTVQRNATFLPAKVHIVVTSATDRKLVAEMDGDLSSPGGLDILGEKLSNIADAILKDKKMFVGNPNKAFTLSVTVVAPKMEPIEAGTVHLVFAPAPKTDASPFVLPPPKLARRPQMLPPLRIPPLGGK